MLRRSLATIGRRATSATQGVRKYTNYDHIDYPVFNGAVVAVLGYFTVMWFIFASQGSTLWSRAEYKRDLFAVWRRKLGTGYQWADAWGPEFDTIFKELPEEVE